MNDNNEFSSENNIEHEAIETEQVTLKQPEKKNRLTNMLERLGNLFKQVINDYPVTMILVFIATLFGSVLVETSFDSDLQEILVKIMVAIWISAAGTLVTEQFIKKMGFLRIGFYILSIIIGIVFVVIFDVDEYAHPLLLEMTYYVLGIYIYGAGIITVYKMYKDNNTSFVKYVISAFAQVMKATIVYGLFIGGISIIVLIFNFLILDTNDFNLLIRLIVFLTGGVYIPSLIRAFSTTKEEINKFIRFVILYVLFPMLLAALGIIYIYIIKLIVSFDLPSNEVFNILAFLFSIGLPIWTMAMNFQDKKLGRISRFVPFIYAPFIILEIICIGLRIGNYGITVSRYYAVAFIIFQIVYIGIYAVKTGKYIENILFVSIAILIITLLVPGINAQDVTIKSQAAIIDKLLTDDFDSLSRDTKSQIKSSYNAIDYDCGERGEIFLKEHFKKSLRKKIDAWSSYNESTTIIKNYSWYSGNTLDLDISDYNRITSFSQASYDEYGEAYILYIDNNRYDITDIINEFTEYEDEYEDYMNYSYNGPSDNDETYNKFFDKDGSKKSYFDTHKIIVMPDGCALSFKQVSYTVNDGEMESYNYIGYFLSK